MWLQRDAEQGDAYLCSEKDFLRFPPFLQETNYLCWNEQRIAMALRNEFVSQYIIVRQ